MIPILLDKTKTLAELVTSKTGGIGDISDAFDGVAVEEANGLKEVTFKLPIDSPRYSQLTVGSYIKVKADEEHDDLQIYEVYKITKPLRGIVTVKAQHISYILGKATVMPFTAVGIDSTVSGMLNKLEGTYPFTFDSDITNSTSRFTLSVPMSFRGAIGGWKGSILDVFGGELDWDNLNVHLYVNRGTDRGVRIEYGKNLTDLTQEESIANVYDAVVGYAVFNEATYVSDIQKVVNTDSPRTLNVDFSSSFEETEPTKTALNQLALAYAQNNNIGTPSVNLKVSFEPLSKFIEYEDIAFLEEVRLFDTLYVSFPKLGVDAKAKVIRTEYDFINEKPISIELGSAKTNFGDLIDSQIEKSDANNEKAVNALDNSINTMTSIITQSLGLFQTKTEKENGGYQYFLHNKPTLEQSQYQWTINEGGFSLSEDYGQTWKAGIDGSGNAVVNSITANTVEAVTLSGGTIIGNDIQGGTIVGTSVSGVTMTFGNDPYEVHVEPYTSSQTDGGVLFSGDGGTFFKLGSKFAVSIEKNGTYYDMLGIEEENGDLAIYLGDGDGSLGSIEITPTGVQFSVPSGKYIDFDYSGETLRLNNRAIYIDSNGFVKAR